MTELPTDTNIAIFAGYASTDHSSELPFINERLKQLSAQNVLYETYAVRPVYSKFIKDLYHCIRRYKLYVPEIYQWDPSHPMKDIRYIVNILWAAISIILPARYLHHISKTIEKNVYHNSKTIFHAHWVYPAGCQIIQISKVFNLPCVITAHGSDIHTIPNNNPRLKKMICGAMESADKVIFVSHALLKSAKELGYSGENAVVIPNGIDTSEFYPVNKSISVEKTRWRQTHKYVVGFVGHLIPIKRADKFPEIFNHIKNKLNDVEFVIVGNGELRNDIDIACREFNLQVTFTERIPHEDVVYWINLFNVMIFPSRSEGFGCVILEAYACGIPVVGSEIGGIPEALGNLCPSVPEGVDFEKRFADTVCDVILGKYNISKSDLITRAHEFTWASIVQQEIDVYSSVIKIKSTPN